MKEKEFFSKMQILFHQIGIVLSEEELHQFYLYMQLLLEWNEKMNLTAITDPEEIILKHFLDSVTIAKYIADEDTIVDVGTGAGFPGIPIKIIKPNSSVLLVDSLQKRVLFLKEVITKLALQKVEVIHARAEQLGKDKQYRGNYQIATARAVAKLEKLSFYLLPFLKKGGKAICMKGPNIEEVEIANKSIERQSGRIIEIEAFELPGSDMKRNIVVIEKI